MVEVPGPPLVVSQTMSKTRIAPSMVSVSTTDELAAQARQGDREELPYRARAVDPAASYSSLRDALHAGHEQHHAQPEGRPGPGQAERGQRPGVVAQPAAGQSAQAHGPEHGR